MVQNPPRYLCAALDTNYNTPGTEWNNGSYPATCSPEAYDHTVTDAIGMETMNKYWPNVKVDTTDDAYTEFWEHEWTKHGTCSGLSQPDYFKLALDAMPATPSIVAANVGKTISKTDLIQAYGGDNFAVPQCESETYLTQVLNCVSIDGSTGSPIKLIACPDVVVAEGDCGVDIHIAAFGDSNSK